MSDFVSRGQHTFRPHHLPSLASAASHEKRRANQRQQDVVSSPFVDTVSAAQEQIIDLLRRIEHARCRRSKSISASHKLSSTDRARRSTRAWSYSVSELLDRRKFGTLHFP
jgi:hypothetical protein